MLWLLLRFRLLPLHVWLLLWSLRLRLLLLLPQSLLLRRHLLLGRLLLLTEGVPELRLLLRWW